jgi:hypothetical protein
VLVVLLALALPVSLGLSGRPWTVGPLLAMLLGAQALLHVVAEAGAGAHVHGHQMGDAASMGGQTPGAMAAAHVAAALLTALLLRRGDDWVWHLADLLARAWRVARIIAEGPTPAGAQEIGLPRYADQPAALHLLEYAVERRGPPRRAAA